MFQAKTWTPTLETLEDRLTPALTYVFGGGSLFVLGSTANAAVTVASNAGGVSVTDGAATRTFAVTGSLTFIIQMTAANPTFNYNPGVTANGLVNLHVLSTSGLTLNVAGTSNVNINGPLLITTGAGDDAINIDNVNPTGLIINSGAGYDTVLIGYNAPVTVRGGLVATNVNLFGLGNNNLTGPPVTVQGFVNATTDSSTLANDIDVEPEATIMGSLFAAVNGAHQTVSMAGTVLGNLFASLGNGADDFVLIPDDAMIGGSVFLQAASGASTTVSIGDATIGGSLNAVMGNGNNIFSIHATLLGSSITYLGGAGVDDVQIHDDFAAPNARLFVSLGAGDDTFTLDSNSLASVYVNGGTGNNTFTAGVPITIPIFVQNVTQA